MDDAILAACRLDQPVADLLLDPFSVTFSLMTFRATFTQRAKDLGMPIMLCRGL